MPAPSTAKERFERLVALANGTEFEAEADTARRLAEAIRRKCNLADEAPEEIGFHPIPRTWNREITIRVAWYMHLELYRRRGRKGWSRALAVRCKPSQFEAIARLHAFSIAEFRKWQKEARIAAQSALSGHLDALYPAPGQGCLCPKCLTDRYPYVWAERRRICQACGHKGRRFQPKIMNEAYYHAGRDSARRPVPTGGPDAQPRQLEAGL